MKINSAESYFKQAESLVENNEPQLALHMLDIILNGRESIQDEIVLNSLRLKSKILKKKAKDEPSFIAANIINNAVKEIKLEIKRLEQ